MGIYIINNIIDPLTRLVQLLFYPIKLLKDAVLFLVFGSFLFLKKERKLLLVTDKGISTFNLGLFIQVSTVVFAVFVGVLFVKSFSYKFYMAEKDDEVKKMKSVNKYFDEEVKGVNVKLQKINEYLLSITGEMDDAVIEDHNFHAPEEFVEDDLSNLEKETLQKIKRAAEKISAIQYVAEKRIEKIELAIKQTGLGGKVSTDLEKSLFGFGDRSELTAQGGPLLDDEESGIDVDESLVSGGNLEDKLEEAEFSGEFDYLITLEKLVEIIPFSKPMKNYYISSGYGSRVDPITSRKAKHRGLDFVGPAKEKVYSPSEGKVILAGKYHDYGNAVVIDHGFGITTRYGHLSEVKVKKGDVVKRGQLIALQGNTGRSTGSHLHYEVRYKKSPLDPYKFIQAGESLYSKGKKG